MERNDSIGSVTEDMRLVTREKQANRDEQMVPIPLCQLAVAGA